MLCFSNILCFVQKILAPWYLVAFTISLDTHQWHLDKKCNYLTSRVPDRRLGFHAKWLSHTFTFSPGATYKAGVWWNALHVPMWLQLQHACPPPIPSVISPLLHQSWPETSFVHFHSLTLPDCWVPLVAFLLSPLFHLICTLSILNFVIYSGTTLTWKYSSSILHLNQDLYPTALWEQLHQDLCDSNRTSLSRLEDSPLMRALLECSSTKK